MRKNKRKTTKFEYFLLLLIIVLVFTAPDVYLMFRQKYFSNSLRIYPLAQIHFNRIHQEYEDVTDKQDDVNQTHSKDRTTTDDIKVLKLVDEMPLDEQVFVVNSNIIVISNKKLTCYAKDGEKKWEYDINAPQPYITNSANYLYIVNKQKGDIAKMDKNNTITKVVENMGQISDIKASGDVVVFNGANENEFTVLDENLGQKASFKVPNGDVVNFKITPYMQNIVISTIGVDDLKLKNFLLTYDYDGKLIGTADLGQELMLGISTGENLTVITDESLISFDKSARETKRITDLHDIVAIESSGQKVYVLNYTSQSNQQITQFTQFLDVLNQINLENPKDGVLVSDKFCILYDDEGVELYDNRLNFIYKTDIKANISRISWVDDYTFAIIGDGTVQIYEIR